MKTVGRIRAALLLIAAVCLLCGPIALFRSCNPPRVAETIGATGDNPAGWTISTSTGNLVSPSKKITGLENATASGEAVQLGQIPIVARFVTTAALPAYTYNNGSSGSNATITANANGVCPTTSFDGGTVAVDDVVLNQNGASFADNGLYRVTAPLGDGSNPCKLTRVDYADSQAEIVGSLVRVREGVSRRGALYQYINDPTIVMGTTALAWLRIDPQRTTNEVYSFSTDFEQQTLAIANNTIIPGNAGFYATVNTNMAMALVAGTATETGVISIGSGTATAAAASLSWSFSTAPVILATTQYFEIEARIAGPNVLSDGTNTFRFMVGLGDTGSPATVANGIVAEYTQATSTAWLGVNRASSTSHTNAGPTVQTSMYTRWRAVHYAGETGIHHYFDGVEVSGGADTNNVPFSIGLTPVIAFNKSAGGTARTHNIDSYRFLQAWPNGRAG